MKLDKNTPVQLCPVCLLRLPLSEFDLPENSISDALAVPGSSEVTGEVRRSEYAHFQIAAKDDGTFLELGRGSMGVTYKATDKNLHRLVALKVISPRYVNDAVTRQRFLREARAAAALRHPNIASVFYLGSTGEGYFYAMEFVQGETLERILETRGTLPCELALAIVSQVAAALAAANQEGIVHRDIKPGNLMVSFTRNDQPVVKVIDFGLVKTMTLTSEDSFGSTPGTFFGTIRYASPEQIREGRADIRSDIYSLGVTLWEMLVGEVPFDGLPGEIADQHLHAPLPLAKVRDLPRPIVSLLSNMLEKDPARRPQTPDELLALLRAFGTDFDRYGFDFARSKTSSGPLPGKGSRGKKLVLGATLVALVGGGWYFLRPESSHPAVEARSVAVLPFDNLSDEKQSEYFSNGLTDEVIFQLSKISNLLVIARSSVWRYKTAPHTGRKALREIGTELGVATILESSVQKVDRRVKIVTILYDALTNRRLWGATYDRQIEDLFAIQSDVAENIAAALRVRLSADQLANIQQKPTENLTAYDLYLRAQALWELRHDDDNENAIRLLKQALELDPQFALGYAGLANAYFDRAHRFEHGLSWLDSSMELSRKAIELDPKQVRGYTVLARALILKNLKKEAEEPIRKALELAPNDEAANVLSSVLLIDTDRFVEWYAVVRKCHTLNPNNTYEPYTLATICAIIGEKTLMEKWMERAINLEEDTDRRRMLEAERSLYRGNYAEAMEEFSRLPTGLSTVGPRVVEQLVACAERLGDWPAVIRLTNAQIEKGGEDLWSVFNLALALRASGQEQDAKEKMERATVLAREELAKNEHNVEARTYLSFACRFLGHKEEAYQNLRMIFPGMLENLMLFRDDYYWTDFAGDPEFVSMLSDFDRQNEINRARIKEIEKGF